MLDEARVGSSVIESAAAASIDKVTWQEADRALRRIAARRAGLDAEEARWLLIARATEAHLAQGFSTFAEYIEHVLHYGPHAFAERMRVAEALEQLPATTESLTIGRVCYSAIRELTRVATPATEDAWLAAAKNRTVRDIETMVAGHKVGDRPGDPADPDLRTFALRFELSPEHLALFRDARRHIVDEAGGPLTDEEVLAAMCRAALTHGPEAAAPSRPGYQISLMVCETCDRGWQEGAGQPIEVGPAVVDQARCDATEIGRVDGDRPARAKSTIPPSTRRLVLARDQHRCVVPGCRASRFLEVHHLRHRAAGGGNEPTNLAVLCSGHHAAHHDGRLVITGEPGRLTFTHADGRPWGAPPPEPEPPIADQVRGALRRLGFKAVEADVAVRAAASHVGPREPIEVWLHAALRATPRPR